MARKFVKSLAWDSSGRIIAPVPTADFILDTDLPAAAVLTSGTYADPAWVTSLNAAKLTGTLPTAVLPALAINDIFTVASQAAMLALTAQRGDMAIRTDNGTTYVLSTDSPGTLADWKAVTVPGAGVTSWNSLTGAVSATTTNLPEGTNLYFTNARADARIAAAVGVSVQGYDPELTALAGLVSAADRIPYFTGSGTAALNVFTPLAQTLLSCTTESDARAYLMAYSSAGGPITGTVTVQIANPQYVSYYPGLPSPTGMWRTIVGSSGNYFVQENTATAHDFSTANTPLAVYGGMAGVEAFTVLTGTQLRAHGPIETDYSTTAALGTGRYLYTGNGTVARSQHVLERLVYAGTGGDSSYLHWMFNGGAGTQMMSLSRWGNLIAAGWIASGNYLVAPINARNVNLVGSTAGNNQILLCESGNAGNDFRKLAYLVRNAAGTDWQTTVYQDGIDIDNVWSTPASLRSWIKRNPLLGQVIIGDQGAEYFRTDPTYGSYLFHSGSYSTLNLWGTGGRAAELAMIDAIGTPFARYIRQYAGNFEFINNAYSLVSHSFGNTGNMSWAGVATGNGSGITALNASQLTTGTVGDARLSAPLQVAAAPGAANTVLQSNGSALLWATVPAATTVPTASGKQPFRLTLTTGVSVDHANVVAAPTVYLTRHTGGMMEIPNSGGSISLVPLTADLSLTLSGTAVGTVYDVFLYLNSGTPTLELGPAWTNDTTRAAGGLLTWSNGLLCKTGAPTRMWVGTIRTGAADTAYDTDQFRLVSNRFNKVRKRLRQFPGVAGLGAGGSVWWARSTNDSVYWVSGDTDNTIQATWRARYNGANATCWAGIAIDTTSPTPTLAEVLSNSAVGQFDATSNVVYEGQPGIGYHWLMGLLNDSNVANYDLSQGGYGWTGNVFC